MHFVKEYMQNNPNKDFDMLLNEISGYTQSVEVSISMEGMGGVKSISELISSTKGFEQATIKEFLRFHKLGYSAGDLLYYS